MTPTAHTEWKAVHGLLSDSNDATGPKVAPDSAPNTISISPTGASPALFSFNSPVGACPECRGFGRVIGLDWNKIIPNPALTLAEGAIAKGVVIASSIGIDSNVLVRENTIAVRADVSDGAAVKTIHDTCAEVNTHLEQIRGVASEIGVGMLEGASKYGRHNFRAIGVRGSSACLPAATTC